jgi:hypothetical protein
MKPWMPFAIALMLLVILSIVVDQFITPDPGVLPVGIGALE